MQAINHLPLPQTEPCTDYQLFSGKVAGKFVAYLVYAAKRDYLSVPTTHIVIAYYNTSSEPIDLLKWELKDYIETSGTTSFSSKSGFFEKKVYDEVKDNKDELHHKNELTCLREVILLLGNNVLEIRFSRYEKLITFYHEINAKSAFSRFLRDNNIDFKEDH